MWTRAAGFLAGAMGAATLIGATPASARVALDSSTGDVLFSRPADPNCRALNETQDANLPRNVVRLRADIQPAADPSETAPVSRLSQRRLPLDELVRWEHW